MYHYTVYFDREDFKYISESRYQKICKTNRLTETQKAMRFRKFEKASTNPPTYGAGALYPKGQSFLISRRRAHGPGRGEYYKPFPLGLQDPISWANCTNSHSRFCAKTTILLGRPVLY